MSKWTWELFWERLTSIFKYIVAVYMMLIGLLTPWAASSPDNLERLGWVYTSKWSLVALGLIIFLSGLWLFVGKIRKNRRQTGRGLMAIFCCFLFGAALNSVALGIFDYGNLIGALIMGLLYLRWRFKTAYIDPNHFRDEAERLTYEHHRLSTRER
jgi:predicted Na+-dependent transporter